MITVAGIITGLRMAAIAAGIGLVWWVGAALVDYGRRSALDEMRAANAAADSKADAIERRVLECPPGMWNRHLQKCEKETTR